ncbi:MAG: hypothetical protein LC799_33895 [Actinobacteria bacterium]|nr:hypothetical protein [Actinomycetota bacterium]
MPPAKEDEHDIRFADSQVATGWERLCAQAVNNTRRAWEAIVPIRGPSPLDSPLAVALPDGRDLVQVAQASVGLPPQPCRWVVVE